MTAGKVVDHVYMDCAALTIDKHHLRCHHQVIDHCDELVY